MLALFPSLLSYGQLGPFLLRVTLAIVLMYWAYTGIKMRTSPITTIQALIEGLAGLLLFVGLFTQGAALVAAIILATKLGIKIKTKSLFTNGVNYYFILFIISLSILVLGAGVFAFDYPL